MDSTQRGDSTRCVRNTSSLTSAMGLLFFMAPSKKSVGMGEGGVTSFIGGKKRGAAEVARPAAQIGQVSERDVVGWGYVLRSAVVRSSIFTAQTKLLDSSSSSLLAVFPLQDGVGTHALQVFTLGMTFGSAIGASENFTPCDSRRDFSCGLIISSTTLSMLCFSFSSENQGFLKYASQIGFPGNCQGRLKMSPDIFWYLIMQASMSILCFLY